MAFGKTREASKILPRCKYDARVGQFYLVDRVPDNEGVWRDEQRNVDNDNFSAVFDMANLLLGWMHFPKSAAPDLRLIKPGMDWRDEPPSKSHKLGVRLLMSIDGHLRECMSTSVGLWAALDKLHDQFLAETATHPGQLPVVGIDNVIKTETSAGASCEPVLAIDGWVDRPPELPAAGIPVVTAEKKKSSTSMDDEIPF
jgi:hypothetical protein